MRGRLIELIQKEVPRPKADALANHLLANGVIVPPCKIGTKVYVITSQTSDNRNLYIFEDVITHYYIADNYVVMGFDYHLGVHSGNWDKVFLTKEEAEEKLKELKDNG